MIDMIEILIHFRSLLPCKICENVGRGRTQVDVRDAFIRLQFLGYTPRSLTVLRM